MATINTTLSDVGFPTGGVRTQDYRDVFIDVDAMFTQLVPNPNSLTFTDATPPSLFATFPGGTMSFTTDAFGFELFAFQVNYTNGSFAHFNGLVSDFDFTVNRMH